MKPIRHPVNPLLIFFGIIATATINAAPIAIEIPPNQTTSQPFGIRLSPTSPGQIYTVLSRTNWSQAHWEVELHVEGDPTNSFTEITITPSARQSLFLKAGPADDSDGDGLSDVMERSVFKTDPLNPDSDHDGNHDGYEDPDNDGWTNLRELELDTDPLRPDQPPASPWLTVTRGDNSSSVFLRWYPSPGPVEQYVIESANPGEPFEVIAEVGPETLEYEHRIPQPDGTGGAAAPEQDRWYRVYSRFTDGFFVVTPPIRPGRPPLPKPSPWIVRGIANFWYLSVGPIPSATAHVRVARLVFDRASHEEVEVHHEAIPAHHFHNGRAPLPMSLISWHASSQYQVQFIDQDGRASAPAYASLSSQYSSHELFSPWHDATEHLNQNIRFVLRAATQNNPFKYLAFRNGKSDTDNFSDLYVHAGFVQGNPSGRNNMRLVQPLIENALYRNFVFDPDRLDARTGRLTNGVTRGYAGWNLNPPAFFFDHAALMDTPPHLTPEPLLSTSSHLDFPMPGISTEYKERSALVHMEHDLFNYFGLAYRGGRVVVGEQISPLELLWITPSQPAEITGAGPITLYPEVVTPDLVQVGHYAGILHNPWYRLQGDPIPGEDDFDLFTSPPHLLVPLDQSSIISTWSKQRIRNGNPDALAFVQQYMASSFKVDAAGDRTLTRTGYISEYGDFFPTEPGPAQTRSQPDPYQGGVRADVLVHTFALQTDKNHDKLITPEIGTADHITLSQPFVFWINEDNDGVGVGAERSALVHKDSSDTTINSMRDLEDFARLRIAGLPSSLASDEYEVTLSWRYDTGPTINLFHNIEGTTESAYLTDANSVEALFEEDQNRPALIKQLSPTASYTFPAMMLSQPGPIELLFEGVTTGIGILFLEIKRNGSTVGTHSIRIELRRIRDMYERVSIRNVPALSPPQPGFLEPPPSHFAVDDAAPRNPTEARQIVVWTHGWRTTEWEYERAAETFFKRLWWEGYQGRFVALRWPTPTVGNPGPVSQFGTFNLSEFIAFNSGLATSSFLQSLADRFPGYAINLVSHSQGSIVMLEAMKVLRDQQRNIIANSIFLQGAFPIDCVDPAYPGYQPFQIPDVPAPNGYLGYALGINEIMSGKLVNYFNPVDFALSTGEAFLPLHWEGNQINSKPDRGFGYAYNPPATFNTIPTPRIVTDPHEIMAFCSRPSSRALGSTGDVAGEVHANRNLQQDFGFSDQAQDHNAQYHWPIQRLTEFLATMAADLGIN